MPACTLTHTRASKHTHTQSTRTAVGRCFVCARTQSKSHVRRSVTFHFLLVGRSDWQAWGFMSYTSETQNAQADTHKPTHTHTCAFAQTVNEFSEFHEKDHAVRHVTRDQARTHYASLSVVAARRRFLHPLNPRTRSPLELFVCVYICTLSCGVCVCLCACSGSHGGGGGGPEHVSAELSHTLKRMQVYGGCTGRSGPDTGTHSTAKRKLCASNPASALCDAFATGACDAELPYRTALPYTRHLYIV